MITQIIKVILEAIKGNRSRKNKPQADMYLPDYIMVLGVVLLIAAVGFTVAFIITHALWLIITAPIAVLLGIAALLCWKNQMIKIISDEKFEYTTFWGNKYTYRFDEITSVRRNSDSTTVFVGEKKVHIEDCAIMTAELAKRLNGKK